MEKGRFFVNQGEMRGFLSFFIGRLEWFVCPYPVASAGNACELLSLTVIEERLESRHLQLYRPQRGNPMNIFRLTTTTLSLTLLVLVAACGGGGGSSNSPNTLSASDVWDVLRDRAARADAYFLDSYGKEPNDPNRIIRPTNGITCSGVNCSYEINYTDSVVTVDNLSPQDAYPNEPLPQNTSTVSFDGGITGRTGNITFFRFNSVSIEGGGMQTFQDYGGWMSGNVFGVGREIFDYPEDAGGQFPPSSSEFYGFSFGDSPETNPQGTGRAEWSGAMIGMRDSNQNVVRGDVSVDIDNLASPDVDVNFFNIRDMVTGDRVMWNGESNFGWDNLDLVEGKFDTHAEIKGSFYGGNHEEVGGVFHTGNSEGATNPDGITGAFGATRQ